MNAQQKQYLIAVGARLALNGLVIWAVGSIGITITTCVVGIYAWWMIPWAETQPPMTAVLGIGSIFALFIICIISTVLAIRRALF